MFLNLDRHNQTEISIWDDQRGISFKDLIDESARFYKLIDKRTLVFVLADNSITSLISIYSCIQNKVPVLVLNNNIELFLFNKLIEVYSPEFIFKSTPEIPSLDFELHERFLNFHLLKSSNTNQPLHPDLSLLLSTSGSTGSPKLVRHSYLNLSSSANAISEFFNINSSHKAIVFLPIYYTMGFSVIMSHLNRGAKIYLTNFSMTDPKFWNILNTEGITTITGVPYSFEIFEKLRFFKRTFPALRIITQGGGKLSKQLYVTLVDYCNQNNIQFFPTYGQTEGTARMAYLNPEFVLTKAGSIGKAIPNGKLGILKHDGLISYNGEEEGEMTYEGENVTMGYALTKEDLLLGDINNGFLKTGDVVKRDADGFYFIIGRKNRFLKIFGVRINLEDVERIVNEQFFCTCIASGTDEKLIVSVDDKYLDAEAVKQFIVEKIGLFHKVVEVAFIEQVKRTDSGKIIKS